MDDGKNVMNARMRWQGDAVRERRQLLDNADRSRRQRKLVTVLLRGPITGTHPQVLDEDKIADFELFLRAMGGRQDAVACVEPRQLNLRPRRGDSGGDPRTSQRKMA